MSQPRIVFAGTPAFAADHLSALIDAGHDVVGVYTQPDRPAKRGKKLTASPVKTLAQSHDVPVYQPLNFKEQADIDELAALKPDILVVVAYGLILPQAVLDIPTIAPINVHGSLLPRWRGAAPIERAIEAGDTETGIGIMVMEAGLDTGPVIKETRCAIPQDMTGDTLRETLSTLGCDTLLATIPELASQGISATAQPEDGVTYAHKLRRDETAIDWSLPATAICNKVRAFNSTNVTTFTVAEKRIKLWLCQPSTMNSNEAPGTIIHTDKKTLVVACGEGSVELQQLQMPGGKALACRDILNGHAATFAKGTVLS